MRIPCSGSTPGPSCPGPFWKKRHHAVRASAVVLWAWLLLHGTALGETMTFDFDTTEIGRLPAGFTAMLTGRGAAGAWRIFEDAAAPSGRKVLAQTSIDRTSSRFPLCIYDAFTATDVTVAVQFKAISGTVDQAAGLVVRFQNPENYYLVRANALENNVRLYKVVRGHRTQFAGAQVTVPSGQWQRLALEVKGNHFRVFLNNTPLFEAMDRTFGSPGKIGLWTKADSVTSFDDLTITPAEAP